MSEFKSQTEAIKSVLAPLGALAENLKESVGKEKYYLTTAIAYTNGLPHMGHAYEFITADALVRFHRVFGYDAFFLTGSDEHGQKVAASAEKAGRSPIEHCDFYVNAFKDLNNRLGISNNKYIRTTDPYHESSARVSNYVIYNTTLLCSLMSYCAVAMD